MVVMVIWSYGPIGSVTSAVRLPKLTSTRENAEKRVHREKRVWGTHEAVKGMMAVFS